MYKGIRANKTIIRRNESYTGDTIEKKIRRILNNKEPITDGAPLIYTDRKDGVLAEYDIRTDRFEVALDATDAIAKSHTAKREERHKPQEQKDKEAAEKAAAAEKSKNNAGGESTQTTD